MPYTSTTPQDTRNATSIEDTGARPDLILRLFYSLLVALVSAPIFIAFRETASDNITHTAVAASLWVGEGEWPPNFLYFFLLGLFGWLIGDTTQLELSATIVLSFAVGLKAFLTTELLKWLAPRVGFTANVTATTILLFSFALPVTFLLGLNNAYYLGNITPNVWHNSTTIFLMPFAIGAFMLQARDLEAGTTRHVVAISILVVAGLLVKPSFYFAYAPATALWILVRFRHIDRPLVAVRPIVLGGIVTMGIYVAVYHLNQGSFHREESGIAFSPFTVWNYFVPAKHIPLAVFVSFLAPLLYLVFGFRPARATWLAYAALLLACGLVVFALATETGPRQIHGNFSWQTVVCVYLLHAVIIAELLRKWTYGQRDWRILSIAAVYVAMFVAGLGYLYRVMALGAPLPY